MTQNNATAFELNIVSCQECGLLVRNSPSPANSCPRCATALYPRKVHSVSRTWALMLAAAILYIPANLLPIMVTTSLNGTQRDTILSGIISLWTSGSWGISVIVFIASITVPLLKIFVLALLLYGTQRRPGWQPQQLTRLYRLVKVVGRWSMLDIYVITILTALVQFPMVARVNVGPAAIPFAAVVVLTMLATMQFDPRLIWDACDKRDGHDRKTE
ncbi:paraquat-inducible protein A [Pelotalea chapellei]|uniref:Paraquat-inducible protein A n=1 Tax=Pelotalea chapellei TaxID=44671 RepID=A0ABS5U6X1_9BACT|nr:paraquat-inducible protein A [Pelotalea chapellei]MBT1071393.1 paraquat-inducible protein A [Pelotalea chapellei]